MNLLIQKLREGEIEYQKGPEDGQLIPIQRPPTRTALWAANEIEKLNANVENLSLAYDSLSQSYTEMQRELNQCLQSIHELTESLQAGTQTPMQETTNLQEPQSKPNLEQPTNNQS